jgi:hypothetical protein
MPGSVDARDGALTPPAPASHPLGTSVEVRDLFFNVPARRKFLRTEATEYQHIVRMLERLALSRFETAFSLAHNGKVVWSLAAAHSPAERLARVAKICGEDFAGHVIELNHDTESLRLSGWLALPTFSRSQSDLQFAFLNGRYRARQAAGGSGAPRLPGRAVPRPLFRLPAVLGIGSAPKSTSTRTRKNWKCDFATRGGFMISCFALWSGCWPRPGPAPNRRAARRSIGSRAVRVSMVAAPNQARFALPEGRALRAARMRAMWRSRPGLA